jgi:hypothetical protein
VLALGVLAFYGTLEVKERWRMVLKLNNPLTWYIFLSAPGNQFLAVKNLKNTACTSNFGCPNYFLLSRRG